MPCIVEFIFDWAQQVLLVNASLTSCGRRVSSPEELTDRVPERLQFGPVLQLPQVESRSLQRHQSPRRVIHTGLDIQITLQR